MSTSPAEPADFVGFPKHSEGSQEAPSAERSFIGNEVFLMSESDSWPESDPRIIDLVAVHSVDIPATATTTGTSRLQGESATRMPHAPTLSVELPVIAGLPRITDEEIDLSSGVFVEAETWLGTPIARRSRHSSPGAKVFLVICMIAIPIAVVLAFTSARSSGGLESIWAAWMTDGESPAPFVVQTTLPSAPEPPPIPAATATNNKFQLLPFQPESPRSAEAEESSSSKLEAVTTSMVLPSDMQPAIAAPQAEALSSPIEGDGVVARNAPEPEVQTPPMQATPPPDTMPDAVTAQVAALPSTPAVEEMTIDNATTDVKGAPISDRNLGSEPLHLREAQAGVWTYCAVNLIPTGQIAVQKATTYQSCILAAKTCAGPRRYAEIQFFDRPTLTSKVPLELCDRKN